MDTDTISKMLVFLILFGIPFLYVLKVRHPLSGLWERYVRFMVILYGPVLMVAIISGKVMYYYYSRFGDDQQFFIVAGQGTIALLGAAALLWALYTGRRVIQRAPTDCKRRDLSTGAGLLSQKLARP